MNHFRVNYCLERAQKALDNYVETGLLHWLDSFCTWSQLASCWASDLDIMVP